MPARKLPDGVLDLRKVKTAFGEGAGGHLTFVVAYNAAIEAGSERYEAIRKFTDGLKAPPSMSRSVMLLPVAPREASHPEPAPEPAPPKAEEPAPKQKPRQAKSKPPAKVRARRPAPGRAKPAAKARKARAQARSKPRSGARSKPRAKPRSKPPARRRAKAARKGSKAVRR